MISRVSPYDGAWHMFDAGYDITPLGVGTKIPVLKNWNKQPHCTEQDLEKWEAQTPGRNYGVITTNGSG